MKDMNYYETFITVAADCPLFHGEVPIARKSGTTKPLLEYELLSKQPYTFTQEDLLFEVHIRHKAIPSAELEENERRIRDAFFEKPQPCLRASMLPKKYGWGIHFNEHGKIALYGAETAEYKEFIRNSDGELKILPAMRNSREKNKM
ncbi:DUF6157 family protein [Fictibacillus nanhaiensis]|uniref:DUF6157 family protein n=1 Tax=Fictibacillus nanhaiensis TaxID=742169 RepID=UPI00203AF20B|nr:DUF6157 family protein [Fictibacillus nanhaiensis]MCM3733323.1 DUF6157 family protein [Fictibacillus nanhaiensis]